MLYNLQNCPSNAKMCSWPWRVNEECRIPRNMLVIVGWRTWSRQNMSWSDLDRSLQKQTSHPLKRRHSSRASSSEVWARCISTRSLTREKASWIMKKFPWSWKVNYFLEKWKGFLNREKVFLARENDIFWEVFVITGWRKWHRKNNRRSEEDILLSFRPFRRNHDTHLSFWKGASISTNFSALLATT